MTANIDNCGRITTFAKTVDRFKDLIPEMSVYARELKARDREDIDDIPPEATIGVFTPKGRLLGVNNSWAEVVGTAILEERTLFLVH
ncbi:MAG: hypothetical protein AAB388_04370 [Patescibacteria group bacterium]